MIFTKAARSSSSRSLGRHLGVFAVAVDVGVEHVLPQPGARRARLQLGHVHAVAGHRLEQAVDRPRPVGRGEHQRGAVLARGPGVVVGDDQEARRVVGIVLDVGREDVEPVELRRGVAGDGAGLWILGGHARGLGVARHRDARQVREVAVEPLVALRQRLRVRVDAAGGADALGARHQLLVDAQAHLAAHLERVGQQQVERAADRALGGVLHRHHAVVGIAGFHRAEDVVDRRHRQEVGRGTEVLAAGALGEGAGGGRGRPRAAAAPARGEADITSRKMVFTASEDSGPGLSSASRRSTCASRSGR